MGDGRYYSAHQFINIVLLSILFLVAVASTVVTYYKNKGSKLSNLLTAIFLLVTLLIGLKFCEEIVQSAMTAKYINLIRASLIITTILLLCVYIYNRNGLVVYITGCVTSVSMIGFGINPQFLIAQYVDFHAIYTKNYTIILGLLIVCLILISLRISEKGRRALFIICFCMPLIALNMSIFRKMNSVCWLEILTYAFYLVGANGLCESIIPYNLSTSMFTNVDELTKEFLWVLDKNMCIIYQNEKTRTEEFTQKRHVNVNIPASLFNKQVEITDKYEQMVIVSKNKKQINYYSYDSKPLMRNQKIMGYIVLLTNVNPLIELLEKQEQQRLESEKLHFELAQYSQIAYRIEKQNQIVTLLKQVAMAQEVIVKDLENDIGKIIVNPNSNKSDIQQAIAKGKAVLNDVRQAVNTYMEYYGESND